MDKKKKKTVQYYHMHSLVHARKGFKGSRDVGLSKSSQVYHLLCWNRQPPSLGFQSDAPSSVCSLISSVDICNNRQNQPAFAR